MTRVTKEEKNRLELTFDDLIGKQSVRATFRLPQEVIDLLNVIASQLGIKKKSLFDQLVENDEILEEVADEALRHHDSGTDRRQKTFVISRSSLQSINAVSEQKQVSRDLLVEMSIRRLLPIIQIELEKHAKRKELQQEMSEYLSLSKALLEKSARLLGKDDELYRMLKQQMAMAQKNLVEINKIVKKGKAMENW